MTGGFALVVLVCVQLLEDPAGGGACDLLESPIRYESVERCRMAGAMLAGRYAAGFRQGSPLAYRIACADAAASGA